MDKKTKRNLRRITGSWFTLFIVFLILKLTRILSCSWLWVTSPLWIPIGIGVFSFAVSCVAIAIKWRGGKNA
jgi:hypothetical protein